MLWFFGAIVAAATSILVIDRVPESARDAWELLVSFAFFAVYALAALLLGVAYRSSVPAGLMAAVAVAMVPAIGYGFTSLIGTFPDEAFSDPLQDFSGSVFAIGVATIGIALAGYALTSFSFLLGIVATATHVTAQLLLPALDPDPGAGAHATAAIVVGAGLVVVGLLLDRTQRRRDAFWLYVAGFLGLAAVLVYYSTGIDGESERGWIPMLVGSTIVLVVAAPLRRATWAVYGAAGLGSALIHYLVKSGSWFVYLLLAVALGAFVLGLLAHRNGGRSRRVETSATAP